MLGTYQVIVRSPCGRVWPSDERGNIGREVEWLRACTKQALHYVEECSSRKRICKIFYFHLILSLNSFFHSELCVHLPWFQELFDSLSKVVSELRCEPQQYTEDMVLFVL